MIQSYHFDRATLTLYISSILFKVWNRSPRTACSISHQRDINRHVHQGLPNDALIVEIRRVTRKAAIDQNDQRIFILDLQCLKQLHISRDLIDLEQKYRPGGHSVNSVPNSRHIYTYVSIIGQILYKRRRQKQHVSESSQTRVPCRIVEASKYLCSMRVNNSGRWD